MLIQNSKAHVAYARFQHPLNIPFQAPVSKLASVPFNKEDSFIKQSPVKFQGRYTSELLDRGFLMTINQLHQSLHRDTDPYYESFPPSLAQNIYRIRPREVLLPLFDNAAQQLQNAPSRIPGEKRTLSIGNGEMLSFEYVASGSSGDVYKLKLPNCPPLAFKVANARKKNYGTFEEIVNGAFYKAHKFTNTTKLYLANPYKDWSLMEFKYRPYQHNEVFDAINPTSPDRVPGPNLLPQGQQDAIDTLTSPKKKKGSFFRHPKTYVYHKLGKHTRTELKQQIQNTDVELKRLQSIIDSLDTGRPNATPAQNDITLLKSQIEELRDRLHAATHTIHELVPANPMEQWGIRSSDKDENPIGNIAYDGTLLDLGGRVTAPPKFIMTDANFQQALSEREKLLSQNTGTH